MRELPKELTVELLGLVIGYKVTEVFKISNEYLTFKEAINKSKYVNMAGYSQINLDTLTRIMIDWCLKQNEVYKFQIDCHNKNTELTHLVGKTVVTVNEENNNFIGDVLSEAVLKTTHWVAKEKGYIK